MNTNCNENTSGGGGAASLSNLSSSSSKTTTSTRTWTETYETPIATINVTRTSTTVVTVTTTIKAKEDEIANLMFTADEQEKLVEGTLQDVDYFMENSSDNSNTIVSPEATTLSWSYYVPTINPQNGVVDSTESFVANTEAVTEDTETVVNNTEIVVNNTGTVVENVETVVEKETAGTAMSNIGVIITDPASEPDSFSTTCTESISQTPGTKVRRPCLRSPSLSVILDDMLNDNDSSSAIETTTAYIPNRNSNPDTTRTINEMEPDFDDVSISSDVERFQCYVGFVREPIDGFVGIDTSPGSSHKNSTSCLEEHDHVSDPEPATCARNTLDDIDKTMLLRLQLSSSSEYDVDADDEMEQEQYEAQQHPTQSILKKGSNFLQKRTSTIESASSSDDDNMSFFDDMIRPPSTASSTTKRVSFSFPEKFDLINTIQQPNMTGSVDEGSLSPNETGPTYYQTSIFEDEKKESYGSMDESQQISPWDEIDTFLKEDNTGDLNSSEKVETIYEENACDDIVPIESFEVAEGTIQGKGIVYLHSDRVETVCEESEATESVCDDNVTEESIAVVEGTIQGDDIENLHSGLVETVFEDSEAPECVCDTNVTNESIAVIERTIPGNSDTVEICLSELGLTAEEETQTVENKIVASSKIGHHEIVLDPHTTIANHKEKVGKQRKVGGFGCDDILSKRKSIQRDRLYSAISSLSKGKKDESDIMLNTVETSTAFDSVSTLPECANHVVDEEVAPTECIYENTFNQPVSPSESDSENAPILKVMQYNEMDASSRHSHTSQGSDKVLTVNTGIENSTTSKDDFSEQDISYCIKYVLRLQQAISKKILTENQAEAMMNLPKSIMELIVFHFETCDTNADPIDWDSLLHVVDAFNNEDANNDAVSKQKFLNDIEKELVRQQSPIPSPVSSVPNVKEEASSSSSSTNRRCWV